MRAGQGPQKIPAAVNCCPIAVRVFQLIARPEDGSLGARVETFGVEQRTLVVVAQQANAGRFDDQVQTLTWVRTVANDIAQAKNLFYALLARIGKDRPERFQVAVNIADDSPFQFTARFGTSGIGKAAARM
jgi:hypothetical protein